jgi:hypothetical protein
MANRKHDRQLEAYIKYAPTPDSLERLSRALSILLEASVRCAPEQAGNGNGERTWSPPECDQIDGGASESRE